MNRSYYKKKRRNARGVGGFMSGVLVLSFSTVIVKIIGLAVKIPMLSILGAEGMGYFNSAYEIYAMLCVIATAGLPTALSILVSAAVARSGEDESQGVYRAAMRIFVFLGVLGSGGMLLFARPLSSLIGNEDAYYCILAIAPALLLICICSCVRGYFQGLGDMTPTAVSQLIEAFGKLIFGVGFGIVAIRKGLSIPIAASFSILGVTLGILVSTVYLLILRSGISKGKSFPQKNVTESLLRIAIPITLGAALTSSGRVVDMTMLLRRLQSMGMDASLANEIYGSYTTLAVPVFSLVPSLITPIALSLVPQIVAASESENKALAVRISDKAIRLTVLLALPASMGIALYAEDILSLLFSSQNEAIAVAAPLLSLLGISVIFSGLITTTNAILQANKRTVVPIVSMGIGIAVKIILAYFLIGIPRVGAYGAPISTLLCDVTVSAVNLYMIGRDTEQFDFVRIFIKPLLASASAISVSFLIYRWVDGITDRRTLPFLCAMAVAIAFYFIFTVLFRAVDIEDIEGIPLLNKIFNKKIIKKRENKNDG